MMLYGSVDQHEDQERECKNLKHYASARLALALRALITVPP